MEMMPDDSGIRVLSTVFSGHGVESRNTTRRLEATMRRYHREAGEDDSTWKGKCTIGVQVPLAGCWPRRTGVSLIVIRLSAT
jgi:hypothetical protein